MTAPLRLRHIGGNGNVLLREEMKVLLRQSIVIFPKLINLELFNTVAVYDILSDISNSDIRPEI